jgi:hypothetical protein
MTAGISFPRMLCQRSRPISLDAPTKESASRSRPSGNEPSPCHQYHGTDSPPQPRHRTRSLRSSTLSHGLRPSRDRNAIDSSAVCEHRSSPNSVGAFGSTGRNRSSGNRPAPEILDGGQVDPVLIEHESNSCRLDEFIGADGPFTICAIYMQPRRHDLFLVFEIPPNA